MQVFLGKNGDVHDSFFSKWVVLKKKWNTSSHAYLIEADANAA